ncbi:MAG: hypothetical protein ACOCZ8_03195 [Bacteroidota bacterium]
MAQFTFPEDPTGGTLTHRVQVANSVKESPKTPLEYLHNFVVEFNKEYRDKLWLQASVSSFSAIGSSGRVERYATVYVMARFNRQQTRTIEMHMPNDDAFPVNLGVYTPHGTKWKYESVDESAIEKRLSQLLEDLDVREALSGLVKAD